MKARFTIIIDAVLPYPEAYPRNMSKEKAVELEANRASVEREEWLSSMDDCIANFTVMGELLGNEFQFDNDEVKMKPDIDDLNRKLSTIMVDIDATEQRLKKENSSKDMAILKALNKEYENILAKLTKAWSSRWIK